MPTKTVAKSKRSKKYQRRTLELKLDRVTLAPHVTRRSSKRLLSATLIWPRPAIAQRVDLKILEFESGRANFSGLAWSERIMFKEPVEGPFGILFDISRPLPNKTVAAFYRHVGSSLLKLAGQVAGDVVETRFASGLVKTPFEFLAKLVGAKPSKNENISAGDASRDLDVAAWRAGVRKALRVNLMPVEPEKKGKRTRHAEKPVAKVSFSGRVY